MLEQIHKTKQLIDQENHNQNVRKKTLQQYERTEVKTKPIFNAVSPFRNQLFSDPLKRLNVRPNKPIRSTKAIRSSKGEQSLSKQLPNKSLNSRSTKQIYTKINTLNKINRRYQPGGLVRRINPKSMNNSRQYKSIQTIQHFTQPLKTKNSKQPKPQQSISLSVDSQHMYPERAKIVSNNHPIIDSSLLLKSKLQKSYSHLISAYQQAQKRLIQSKFKINILDTIDKQKQCCQEYFSRIINQKQHYNIEQNNEQGLKKLFNQYVPIWRQFKIQQLQKQNNLTMKKYKHSIYFGGLKDNKKQGLGIMVYNDGKVFEGKFENDLRITGMQKDRNEYYIGQFINGAKQGNNCVYKSIDVISFGKFSQDKWVGDGFQLTQNQLICSEHTGISILKTRQNKIFVGNLIDGVKSDICIERFSDGDIYLGSYQDNKPEGYGQYYWVNGAVYQGDFVFGMRHGNGFWFIQGGDSYIGQYSNDKKCGKGQYYWKNGTKYKGMFQNDFRHGYGQMYWNSGRSYKGNWINGIQATKKLTFLSNSYNQQEQSRSRSKSNSKLPFVISKNPLIKQKSNLSKNEFKKGGSTIDVTDRISTNRISHKAIRKDKIRALFNPNYYLQN